MAKKASQQSPRTVKQRAPWRRWLILGCFLALPLLFLASDARKGTVVAADTPPTDTRLHGFLDQQQDRYLLAQVIPGTTDYGQFVVAIPTLGLFVPSIAGQINAPGASAVQLTFSGNGWRDATARLDPELTLRTAPSGQLVATTFSLTATLDPEAHTGTALLTYNGQQYPLTFAATPLSAHLVFTQVVTALQQQDAAALYGAADRRMHALLSQSAFAAWFTSDLQTLGTITAVQPLANPTYQIAREGYQGASGIIELTVSTGGTTQTRWLEVLLVSDGGQWRFSSFAPASTTDLLVTPRGPYTVAEGQTVPLAATALNPTGGTLAYAWDLDNNGSFETSGQTPTFSAATLDGPGTRTVAVRVTSSTGATATGQTTVTVTNVAPTATLVAPGTLALGHTFTLTLTTPQDVPADKPTLQYAFDCGNGTGYSAFGSAASRACPAPLVGLARIVHAQVRDKDGGTSTYDATITLIVGLP